MEGLAEVVTSSKTTKQMWAQVSPLPKDTLCLGTSKNRDTLMHRADL